MELNIHYRSSEGLDLESEMTRMAFYIGAIASKNGIFQGSGEGRSGVGGLELFDRENPVELAEK